MTLIQVMFPIPQEKIGEERERILGRLTELQVETDQLRVILDALRRTCKHPGSSKYGCKLCGADWSD